MLQGDPSYVDAGRGDGGDGGGDGDDDADNKPTLKRRTAFCRPCYF